MIDLTPLDVRKKRGDFRRILRGYDPEEVDHFLELVAERMEVLVRENFSFSDQVSRLREQVGSLEGREKAVHEALVTAEKLRSDVKEQARREADAILREAEAEARRRREEGERDLEDQESALASLERERRQFLLGFRSMLERQLERLDAEESMLGDPAGPPPPPRRSPRPAGYRAARRAWVESEDVGHPGHAGVPLAAPLPGADPGQDPSGGLEAGVGSGTVSRPAAMPAEVADVGESAGPMEASEPVEVSAVPELMEATGPMEVLEPVEVAGATEAVEPVEAFEPVDSGGPMEAGEPPAALEAPEEPHGDAGPEGGESGPAEGEPEEGRAPEVVVSRPGGSAAPPPPADAAADAEDLSRWLASFLEDESGGGR